MKLSIQDAALFYRLMSGLQFWVSQEHEILPDVDSAEAYAELPMNVRHIVRTALWEMPDMIDSYVTQNPHDLPADELLIVSRWRRFVAGRFQVFRFLKRHTIFVGTESDVYGVLALHDSLEEIFNGRPLPAMVEAVLLPFKGKIVYDGFLTGYNVFFGSGIRSALNEEYMAAKQNGRIITTLEPELAEPTRKKKPAKDWRPVVDDLVATTDKLTGGPAVQAPAFGLLRASAKLAQAAAHNPDDLDELWGLERRVRTALSRLQTALNRAERNSE